MTDTNKPTDEPAAAESPSFAVVVVRWQPHRYHGALGALSVRVFNELTIHGIMLRQGRAGGGLWLAMPNVPARDDQGQSIRDHTGHVIYQPLLSWTRPADQHHFRACIMSHLKAYHAADLAAEAAP